MSSGISAPVERFILENIPSVEQLEVLLLLSQSPDKEWSALEISRALYRQPESVATRLEALRDRGLLSVRQASDLLYRYSASAPQQEIVRNLDMAYQERKDAVIRLIFSRPSDNLRAFSDAFRIRRSD
ncbi:MAG: hypothetical protein JWN98_2737 [Abditibacteriota bacterium]|nr:hypothetical protein [Abditibacteriota bacterium]